MNENKKNKTKEETDKRNNERTQSKRNKSKTGSKNKPWRQLLLKRRGELQSDSRSSGGERNYGSSGESNKSSGIRAGSNNECSSEEMETKSGSGIENKFTLQEIKDSVPKEILESLLSNNYNPQGIIIIKKLSKRSKFVEDLYIRNKSTKKRTKSTKKARLPSEIYVDYISKDKNAPVKTEAILGTYFILYRKLFKEEDSEWNIKNVQKALMLINSLIEDTGTSTLEVMSYIKKILPLWYKRLIEGEKFPDRRPTLRVLFSGKRWFWSNRKLLYKQWGEYNV